MDYACIHESSPKHSFLHPRNKQIRSDNGRAKWNQKNRAHLTSQKDFEYRCYPEKPFAKNYWINSTCLCKFLTSVKTKKYQSDGTICILFAWDFSGMFVGLVWRISWNFILCRNGHDDDEPARFRLNRVTQMSWTIFFVPTFSSEIENNARAYFLNRVAGKMKLNGKKLKSGSGWSHGWVKWVSFQAPFHIVVWWSTFWYFLHRKETIMVFASPGIDRSLHEL